MHIFLNYKFATLPVAIEECYKVQDEGNPHDAKGQEELPANPVVLGEGHVDGAGDGKEAILDAQDQEGVQL